MIWDWELCKTAANSTNPYHPKQREGERERERVRERERARERERGKERDGGRDTYQI